MESRLLSWDLLYLVTDSPPRKKSSAFAVVNERGAVSHMKRRTKGIA